MHPSTRICCPEGTRALHIRYGIVPREEFPQALEDARLTQGPCVVPPGATPPSNHLALLPASNEEAGNLAGQLALHLKYAPQSCRPIAEVMEAADLKGEPAITPEVLAVALHSRLPEDERLVAAYAFPLPEGLRAEEREALLCSADDIIRSTTKDAAAVLAARSRR